MAEGAAGPDATISRIADYARGLRFADLPAEAVHACKRRIADTLACGVAAFDAEPSRIVRALALRAEVAPGSRCPSSPPSPMRRWRAISTATTAFRAAAGIRAA